MSGFILAIRQAILKSRNAAGEAQDGTRKGIAEKEIEDMEQRGVISHASALKMKEHLDIQYEQQKLTRMIAQDAVERQVLTNELTQKMVASHEADSAEGSAEAKYKSAATAKTANDTKIDEGKSQISKGEAALKTLSEKGYNDDSVMRLADVRTLQDKITETGATNAIKEGGAKQDLGLRKANDELIGDRATADRLQAGGSVSSVDAQKIVADASRIARHQVDLKTAAQIIENGANNIGIFMNQVSVLATVLGNFTPGQGADLQRQIDELSGQIKSSRRNVGW